ncbi:MAG: 3-phosphoshikimate 1-carboxyvinyltransferase, partial [Planctomycetota bacterium]|nr:3-phosphoshikimate 1-carboxyvinyltransferase [Planctomycetota bacterium]
MDALREIVPVTKPVQGSIRPPGSKSLTNRALICAALSNGRSTLTGSLDSDDTRVMVRALRSLGIAIDADWSEATLNVDGCGGVLPVQNATLDLDGSGTSIRFLTALAATGTSVITLDGNPRMRERPIGQLAEALRQCGAKIETQGEFP